MLGGPIVNIFIIFLKISSHHLALGLRLSDDQNISPGDDEVQRIKAGKDLSGYELGHRISVNIDSLKDLFENPHLRLHSNVKIATESKCLSFIHIPKTAGSSIEVEGFEMAETDNYHTEWGAYTHNFTCDGKHFTCPWAPPGVKSATWQCCELKNQRGDFCSAWHIPPVWDKKIASFYEDNKCETFCVVRHPLQRLISEWKFRRQLKIDQNLQAEPCSVDAFEKYAKQSLEQYAQQNSMEDCHFLPQVDYVFTAQRDKKYCQHELRFESLAEDFGALMKSFNIPLTLTNHNNQEEEECRLNEEAIGRTVRQLVESTYNEDFSLLNYK